MVKTLALLIGTMGLMSTAAAQKADAAETLKLNTTKGEITIELLADLAPKHVERVSTLAKEGFYDDVIFHRVIDGFMAQTGDPTGTGTGGSDKPDVEAEFNDENFGRGVVGAARTQDPNSFNSQFFICFKDCSFLNGQYTVFGKVTDGMDNVDRLAKGEPPANPDKILSASVGE